jgi:hypothetical protein
MVCATASSAHRRSKSGSASRSHDDFERLCCQSDAVAADAGRAGIGVRFNVAIPRIWDARLDPKKFQRRGREAALTVPKQLLRTCHSPALDCARARGPVSDTVNPRRWTSRREESDLSLQRRCAAALKGPRAHAVPFPPRTASRSDWSSAVAGATRRGIRRGRSRTRDRTQDTSGGTTTQALGSPRQTRLRQERCRRPHRETTMIGVTRRRQEPERGPSPSTSRLASVQLAVASRTQCYKLLRVVGPAVTAPLRGAVMTSNGSAFEAMPASEARFRAASKA